MTTFLAILTGGGLALLGGLLSGLLTNWLGDKRDQRKYEHERAMAMDARRQERLEQAYIELLAYLPHQAAWARPVRPFRGTVQADPMSFKEVKRIEALVEAHGSEEVRRLLQQWRECWQKIDDEVAAIGLKEKPTPGQELEDEARLMLLGKSGYLEAMMDAAEAVRERVRQELAGEV
jgi:hypothetical protein